MDVLHENLVLCPLPKDFSLSNLLIPLIFSILGNSSRKPENEQESSSSSDSEGESG